MGGEIIHTTLVQGPLAYAMRRARAARGNEVGLQILTIVQLAARLAGGFRRPASAESIERAVAAALAEPGYLDELEPVRGLPGMARAVSRTLRKTWLAGLDLANGPWAKHPRVGDLLKIEQRIRELLPPGELVLSDLCSEARAAIATAPSVLGPLRIEGINTVNSAWRPLLNDLCAAIPVVWESPIALDASWFNGQVETKDGAGSPEISQIRCADPAHEALEAMRWVRSLLATGKAHASDIAIASVSPGIWDDHFLALADQSGLRLSFVHGRPALTTRDGQRCAALADAMLNGLSQTRIRRLFALAKDQGAELDKLPSGGLPVSRDASLTTLSEWERALAARPEVQKIVIPLLKALERGADGADEAADRFLRTRSRRLWDHATRVAPPAALMFTLGTLRVADEHDPADSIAWCTADELAGAPRPYVWLVGLNSGGWPRAVGEDPILPNHIVGRMDLDPDPPGPADRRAFEIIVTRASAVNVSATRHNAQGKRQSHSSLISPDLRSFTLARDRPARHALTEGDRLFARLEDAASHPQLAQAATTWRNWHTKSLTVNDGRIPKRHPRVMRSIKEVLSPTSLKLLLRDPLGFVWRHALRWEDVPLKVRPLVLPPDDRGLLVHELLRLTVNMLEPNPGFAIARRDEIEEALARAVAEITVAWPLFRPVPPPVLWVNTVRQAAEMALAGLTLEELDEKGTHSWTEASFGELAQKETERGKALPWDPTTPVTVPHAGITIRGKIDRVDRSDSLIHVIDYKTGARFKDPEKVVIAGGAELQRVLYALACRELLPDAPRIVSQLVYLTPPQRLYPLQNPDAVIARVGEWIKIARDNLEAGIAFPGPHYEIRNRRKPHYVEYNAFEIALPASPNYLRRKHYAIREAAGTLTKCWREP